MRRHAWQRLHGNGRWRVMVLVGLAVGCGGCGPSKPSGETGQAPKFEVADDTARAATPGAVPRDMPSQARPQPPSIPGPQLDGPGATPPTTADLVARLNDFDERILTIQAQVQRGEATLADMQSAFESMLQVSDQVLASDADAATRKRAVDAKAGALIVLSQISRDQPWNEKISEFAKSLLADQDPAIAMEGRVILLGMLVGDIAQGKSQAVEELVSQTRSLLANDARGASVMDVSQQAVMALRNVNRDSEARTVFELVAQAFQNHADPLLAAESNNMREQLRMFDLDLDAKFNDTILNKEGAAAGFVEVLAQVLQDPDRGSITLDKALYFLAVLEQNGNYELARQLCDMIKTAYQDSADQETRDFALEKIDLTLRRISLLGTSLSLEGNLFDGTPFDASAYQGKVVVVAFWIASPSCRQELLGLKSLHEQYREQGLEVIGVSLDRDRADADRFLSEIQPSWTNIVLSNASLQQYALELVPFLVLADRQGTILAISVRVQSLRERLPALLTRNEPGRGGERRPG